MKWKDYEQYTCYCGKPAAPTSKCRKDGTQAPRIGAISRKPVCFTCQSKERFAKQGGKEQAAINKGFVSSHHKLIIKKYKALKYFLPFCENLNGKLGFDCRTHNLYYYDLIKYLDEKTGKLKKEYWGNVEIAYKINDCLSSIHVDHIDGNPKNNVTNNLMVLCPHCHTTKGKLSKDHLSEGVNGRKRTGVIFNMTISDDLSKRYEEITKFGKLHKLF